MREQPHTPTAFAGFLLKVSVESSENITDKIFVMRRDVASNYVDGVMDNFYSIVSVAEIEDLPEDDPDPDGTNFFRTNVIELMFDHPDVLEEAWEKIRFDVAALVRAKDASYDLDISEMYEISSDD